MSNEYLPHDPDYRPAVVGQVEPSVRRPGLERAEFDVVGTVTIAQGRNAGTYNLLAPKTRILLMREGCHECAWGKVAGCWRCGGR